MAVARIGSSLLAACVLLYSVSGYGQDISQSAVDRAHDFLKTDQRGREINSWLHFGTTYSGHRCTGVSKVRDSLGLDIPGEFALTYNFVWNRQYSTNLIVFCDKLGNIDSIRAGASDGVLQSPFLASQAVVALLGNVIYEAFREKMSADERAQLKSLIDQADPKSLLEMQLKLQQAFGR